MSASTKEPCSHCDLVHEGDCPNLLDDMQQDWPTAEPGWEERFRDKNGVIRMDWIAEAME